jgi:hypothetical protein
MFVLRPRALVLVFMAFVASPALLQAQVDFSLDGYKVHVHGFASQAFGYSDANSYLTMKTSSGSGAFTDGGVNLSTNLNDKFRVGAQGYVRRLGELNKGQAYLDWAYGDYKFKDWFGIRGGKVKTALGLYNDLQDVDSLSTWALLPQSMYPIDLRGSTIAHIGGDFYGRIRLQRYGSFAYTAYGGVLPNDIHQGYLYGLRNVLGVPKSYVGPVGGGDLKWTTPLKGVLLGASYMTQHPSGNSIGAPSGPSAGLHITQESIKREISQFSVQYTWRKLHIDGEYHRDYRRQLIGGMPQGASNVEWNARSWYTSGAYRFCRWFEAGSYYSRFVPIWQNDPSPADNHIYDKVVTGRFDLNRFWTVKVEGHFIDGYGAIDSARGFYGFNNSSGPNSATMKPQTNMLLIRTGFAF